MIKLLFKQILATIIVFITIVISTALSFASTLPIRVPYIYFNLEKHYFVTIEKKHKNLFVSLDKCLFKDDVKMKIAPQSILILIKKDSDFYKLADKILENPNLIAMKEHKISNSTLPNGFIVSKDRDRMPIDMTLTETRQLIDFLTPYIERQKQRTSQNPECWQNIFH